MSVAGRGASTYGFTGEWTDSAAGLVHLRARFYAPGVGRFFQQDSWGGDYGSPVTLNKYLYANGNPVLYQDPSGQWCVAGFSIGPGTPCTSQEQAEWQRNYSIALGYYNAAVAGSQAA